MSLQNPNRMHGTVWAISFPLENAQSTPWHVSVRVDYASAGFTFLFWSIYALSCRMHCALSQLQQLSTCSWRLLQHLPTPPRGSWRGPRAGGRSTPRGTTAHALIFPDSFEWQMLVWDLELFSLGACSILSYCAPSCNSTAPEISTTNKTPQDNISMLLVHFLPILLT